MMTIGPTDGDSFAKQFFTSRRLVAYPFIFLGVSFIVSLAWFLKSSDLIDPQGQPLGYNFIAFWGASRLALDGLSASVFDTQAILAAERLAIPASQIGFPWHSPPTFLLAILPAALLPYMLSYAVWMLGTLTALAAVIRKMAPQPQTVLLLFAFPGTFINLFQGQSAFLIAALLGGAMLLIERKPIHAGILVGLLAIKPQLLPLVLLALVCGRHWTALLSAAGAMTAVTLLSLVAFGTEPWVAFWNDSVALLSMLDTGAPSWSSMPSLYATLRLLGLGAGFAYTLHIIVALAVAGLVGWIWWRGPSLPLRAAVLVTGALIFTPFLHDYDLAVLAIPLAMLAMDGFVRGWLAGEREILALAWFMPLVTTSFALAINLQIGAVILIALFAVAVRRILEETGPIPLPWVNDVVDNRDAPEEV